MNLTKSLFIVDIGRMAREGERNKLYEVLDAMQTDREGLISYKEFKTFAQEAENDSRCFFSLSFHQV